MAKLKLKKKPKMNDLSISKRKIKKQKAGTMKKGVSKKPGAGKKQLKTKFKKSPHAQQSKYSNNGLEANNLPLKLHPRDALLNARFRKNSKDIERFKSASNQNISEISDPTQLVNPDTIRQAIIGIRKLSSKPQEEKKKKLLEDSSEDESFVFLQVTLCKIPAPVIGQHVPKLLSIKVRLPHSLTDDGTEVMLITKDLKRGIRADHKNTLHYYTELLQRHGAASLISEVIPLRMLKVEYRDYEAKRHLANRFDVVLCDDTVMRFVPQFLGKNFYRKKIVPVQVNLKTEDLYNELTRALSVSLLTFSSAGNSGIMKVGRLSHTDEEIVENILAVVKKLARSIPGGWKNIMNLNLKLALSLSVPIYVKIGSLNDIGVIPQRPLYMKKPISGVLNNRVVTIYPDSSITVVNMHKKVLDRIPEDEIDEIPKKFKKYVARNCEKKTDKKENEGKKQKESECIVESEDISAVQAENTKVTSKEKKKKLSKKGKKQEKESTVKLVSGNTTEIKKKVKKKKTAKAKQQEEEVMMDLDQDGTTEIEFTKAKKSVKKKMGKKLAEYECSSSDDEDLEAQELAYLKKLSEQRKALDDTEGSVKDIDSDEAAAWNEMSDDDVDESDDE